MPTIMLRSIPSMLDTGRLAQHLMTWQLLSNASASPLLSIPTVSFEH